MKDEVPIGSRVRLVQLPEWLLHDLPENEQSEMRACIGQSATVQEIDSYGYLWIGFGATTSEDKGARYSGHSFGVPLILPPYFRTRAICNVASARSEQGAGGQRDAA
jgi:hypothetical protein